MGLIGTNQVKDFMLRIDGVLRFKGRECISNDMELKRLVMDEGHKSTLSMHPGMTKMYHDLK